MMSAATTVVDADTLAATPPRALAQLLGAIDTPTFFRDYFGRRGLHITGSMREAPLFGWSQLNALLNNHKGLPPGAKILSDGKETIPLDYLVLLRDIRRGLTMFFEDIDRYDPTLSTFLSDLSGELQSPTRFNMYLSSPGQQGRKLHYDTHDVFVVQVEGSKRWAIYDITDPSPIYTRKNHESAPPDEATPYLDCTLHKGDVLYLPRGHWHNVNPVDEVSLHLTLGVFFPNGIEFLQWLVDECTEVEGARENIPLRIAFSSDEEYLHARHAYTERILNILAMRARTGNVAEDYEAFCTASLPNRRPFNFPFSMAREEFLPARNTPLRSIEHTAKLTIAPNDASASLVYSNRVIAVPSSLVAVLHEMLSGAQFTVEEVEGRCEPVDGPHLHSLVKALVAEGLVVAAT